MDDGVRTFLQKTGPVLCVDIGSGTQDVLLARPGLEVHNWPRFVLPSPARLAAQRIRELTLLKQPVWLYGENIGGGFGLAVRDHIKAGFAVHSTASAASALHDNPEVVRSMGVQIAEQCPAGAVPVPLSDYSPEFFAGLLLVGRLKGLLSFISIFTTVAMIFFILMPLILYGVNPILAAILVCILATIVTIYIVAGFNRKSTSAVIGSAASLIFAGIISIIAINFAHLTGFAGEETMFLYSARPDLDFTGILTASMMLATLGAVMDIAVSIASTINELYQTNKDLSKKALFQSGMNVGCDIIGTMANTLILVYLGSALPLVLLANNIDLQKFFNLNQVATEIVSALIGSIGILACVPLTAVIASIMIKKK